MGFGCVLGAPSFDTTVAGYFQHQAAKDAADVLEFREGVVIGYYDQPRVVVFSEIARKISLSALPH